MIWQQLLLEQYINPNFFHLYCSKFCLRKKMPKYKQCPQCGFNIVQNELNNHILNDCWKTRENKEDEHNYGK